MIYRGEIRGEGREIVEWEKRRPKDKKIEWSESSGHTLIFFPPDGFP